MSREIKFRVWTGIKMEHNVMVGYLGAFYVKGLDQTDSASMNPFNTIYDKATPVMQFTGLKDKNGVEIYEGDIVREEYFDNAYTEIPKYFVGDIYWESGGYNFRYIMDGNRKAQGVDIHFNQLHAERYEIIGNIYQNPNLLEAKDE